jgi:hypothetical protein
MAFPSFSAGDVLAASDMNAVGLWLVKTQTIGATVGEVEVTSAFSSTYDNYRIMVSGGVGSTAMFLRFQLGSASVNGYYTAYSGVTYSSGAAALSADNDAANFSAVGIATSTSINLNVDLINPNLTEHTYISGFHATATAGRQFSGYYNATTAFTSFKLICSTGNLTGGTIRVYGYRN